MILSLISGVSIWFFFLYYILSRLNIYKFKKNIIISAFFLKSLILILNFNGFNFPYSNAADIPRYFFYVDYLYSDWLNNFEFSIIRSWIWSWILIFFKKIAFGHDFLFLTVPTIMISISNILLFLIIDKIGNKKSPTIYVLLGFFPSYLFFGGVHLKEAPIILCITIILYLVYNSLFEKKNVKHYLVLALASLFLTALQPATILFQITCVIIFFSVPNKNRINFINSLIILLIFIIFYTIFLYYKPGFLKLSSIIEFDNIFVLTGLDNRINNTDFINNFYFDKEYDFFTFVLKVIIQLILAPLSFFVGDLRLSFIFNIYAGFIFYYSTIFGTIFIFKKKILFISMILLISLFIPLTIASNSEAHAMRHILKVFPICFIVIALLSNKRKKNDYA